MPVPPDLIARVAALDPADREELLARFGANLGPLRPARINRTPGVCGGEACVNNTRFPVWLLEEMRRDGATDADLLDTYTQFRPADLAAAWAYVAAHREEIEDAIRRNQEAMDNPAVE